MSPRMDELCSSHQRNAEPGHYCETCARIRTELRIVRRTAQALIADGWTISVNDGEETTLRDSTSIRAIMAKVNTTYEDHFFVRKTPKGPTAEQSSFVTFYYGNSGWDVIHDYGMMLEPVMAAVMEYASAQEDRS